MTVPVALNLPHSPSTALPSPTLILALTFGLALTSDLALTLTVALALAPTIVPTLYSTPILTLTHPPTSPPRPNLTLNVKPKQVLLLLDLVRLGVVGAPLTIGGKLFEVTG